MANQISFAYISAGYLPQSHPPSHQPVVYSMYAPQPEENIPAANPYPWYDGLAYAPQQYFPQPTAAGCPPAYQNVYQPPLAHLVHPYPPQPYSTHAYPSQPQPALPSISPGLGRVHVGLAAVGGRRFPHPRQP